MVVVSLCTFTRVCAEEERLHARECVPQKDWRRAGEGRAASSAWTSYVCRTYVCTLALAYTTHADKGILEVGAPTRGRERDGGGAGGRGG